MHNQFSFPNYHASGKPFPSALFFHRLCKIQPIVICGAGIKLNFRYKPIAKLLARTKWLCNILLHLNYSPDRSQMPSQSHLEPNMLRQFFKTKQSNETVIRSLYGEIVAQARHTTFYEHFGVPDTLDGRFNMIVLHNFLVFRRLKDVDEGTRAVSQDVFDMFRLDMDRSLRELGVGDTTVPKRMKKMMQVFYGRTDAYEAALNGDNAKSDMADALSRNILSYNESLFSEEEAPTALENSIDTKARALADYVLTTTSALEEQDESEILRGSLSFPTPKA